MFSKIILFWGIALLLMVACELALKQPPNLEPYFFQPGELGNLTVSPATRTIEHGIAHYYQTITFNEKPYISVGVDVSLGSAYIAINADPDATPIPKLGDQWGSYSHSHAVFTGGYSYSFTRCNAVLYVTQAPETIYGGNRAEGLAFKLDSKLKNVLCQYQYPAGTPTPP